MCSSTLDAHYIISWSATIDTFYMYKMGHFSHVHTPIPRTICIFLIWISYILYSPSSSNTDQYTMHIHIQGKILQKSRMVRSKTFRKNSLPSYYKFLFMRKDVFCAQNFGRLVILSQCFCGSPPDH